MTPDDLARLKALAEAATPGKRVAVVRTGRNPPPPPADMVLIAAVAPGHQIFADHSGGSYPSSDMEFIAACDASTILALIEAATPVPVPAGEFAIPAVVEHAPVYFENIDPRLTGRDAPEILRSAAMVVRQQMEFLRGTRRRAWDGSYVEALLKAVGRVADSLEGKA